MGVDINDIEKVVRTVLTNFTNMGIESCPKATFTRLTCTESTKLSEFQVAESLLKDYDSYCKIFHANGTWQFGKHDGTYDVVTDQGQTLTSGIKKVSSSYTKIQLSVLVDIFSEIEDSLLDTGKMFPIKPFHQQKI